MTKPRYDPSEAPERKAPEDEAAQRSSAERDRDETPFIQLGEDPGTLEPDPD